MPARHDDGRIPHACEILEVPASASRAQVEAAYLQGVSRLRGAFLDLGGFDGLPRCQSQTFDAFVVGAANRVAVSAFRRVCEAPGSVFNPLYLHGPTGLGKSHLLSAMSARLGELHPSLLVLSTTAERFTEDLVQAMGNHAVAQFHSKYRNVDVLIIDGFDMAGNRLRTQEEFCAVLDPLAADGRQIVIAGQTPPSDLSGLCPSLRSRLHSGLVVEMGYPDLETRKAIVRRLTDQAGLGLSLEAVTTLARRIQHDVRALKGAVNRLIAHHGGEAPSEPDPRLPVADLLYELAPSACPPLHSLEAVIACVQGWYTLDEGELQRRTTVKKGKRARQMAMYLARTVTPASLQETADALCATSNQVLYAVRTVEANLADPLIAADLEALHAALAAAPSRPRAAAARRAPRRR